MIALINLAYLSETKDYKVTLKASTFTKDAEQHTPFSMTIFTFRNNCRMFWL